MTGDGVDRRGKEWTMTNGEAGLQLGLLLRTGEQSQPAGRVVGWSELREMSVMAEAVGFDTIWVADHLIFRNAGSVVMPPGESRGPHEAWTLLSAIAAVTSKVTLGPFVACNSFREPALLAKMADTLEDVSGGRVLLGLGAGWHEPEYTAFGFPYNHLASRFEEALQIIVPLLKGETVTFHGKFYQVTDSELRPRGPRPGGPPIWIGAKGPRMLKMVAKYADAYNSVWHADVSQSVERFANMDAACQEVGRDPATLRRTSGCMVLVPDAGDAPDVGPTAISGSVQEIAEKIWAFHTEQGVSHMTMILDPWTTRGIEQFGRVIETIRSFER
jgi:alkanesulfonate monooxygenase SsuD/methylene tetrahydromethanopterin reductase-like flavin-dependent oxidoreductase (luciferase family)